MLSKFNTYIKENNLCTKDDVILITTSGGVDSVVLLHLFIKSGYKVAIAHCNFNLRGQESDGDEAFVRNLGKEYQIPTHVKSFSTIDFAKENKISVEMAARDLRYNWFNELIAKHSYSKIATGHHINDTIETLFLNLARGTGLKGITGIPNKKGTIIRPLLFATRKEIEKYAETEKQAYRKDSSNESDKYMRNIIRQQVIPALKKINPMFEKTMENNLKHFQDSYSIYNNYIELLQNKIVKTNKDKTEIPIQELLGIEQKETLLFEIIKEFDFNNQQIPKILESAVLEPGKIFYSKTHQLLVDRDFLKIEALEKTNNSFIINSVDEFNALPFSLEASIIDISNFKLEKDSYIGQFDASQIQYPITIRKWNEGDSFFPLGMNKRKKLSDFFIDNKIDRFEKQKIWIFESNHNIFWIGKHRVDNRFKVSENTKEILRLKFT